MRFRVLRVKWYFLMLLLVVLSIAIWVSIILLSEKPPVEKLDGCRKLIAKARNKEADKYSPMELVKAEKLWNEAMSEWKKQNEKSSAFRNFGKVSQLSDEATQNAQKAIDLAIRNREKLHDELKQSLSNLRKTANQIEHLCQKLPVNHGVRENLTPANLKLTEAEQAFSRNDLLQAKRKVDSVKPTIHDLQKKTTESIKSYFSDYDTWVKLSHEMIDWSKKNNSVALVIDKFSRKCYVYKSGKMIKEFDVELGINWLGDKRFRGDMATPEGKYKVTKKKSQKETKYHKALLINFPNDDDKIRFSEAKRKGLIPSNAQIGGLIEIHGDGGKGIDWTEGCVALENSDMDKLFSLCSVGTPMAIVGSLKSIEELFTL